MKRIVTLLVIVLITMSGCSLSKEKVMEKSQFTTIYSIAQKANNNSYNAKKEFVGNYYSIIGYVQRIDEGNVELYEISSSSSGENRGILNVKLSTNEIKKLEKNQRIEVMGKITKILSESQNVNGTSTSHDTIVIHMNNAYVKNYTFEMSGKVKIPAAYTNVLYNSKTTTKKSTWYCYIGTIDVSTFGEEKEFTSSENKASKVAGQYIKNGDNVHFVGKIFYQNNSSTNTTGYAKDIKITKINNEKVSNN